MGSQSGGSVYLFRHGKVKKDNFGALSELGLEFATQLPQFFDQAGVRLTGAFFDGSVDRCLATIERLSCPKFGYGSDREIRTLNAVLSSITDGHYAICCRGDSIESGQLYHVNGFELHTPFAFGRYGVESRAALATSYHMIYCFERDDTGWRQAWKKGPVARVE